MPLYKADNTTKIFQFIHVDNPQTGDFTNLLGMGAMAAIGIIGFGAILKELLTPRKKKKE